MDRLRIAQHLGLASGALIVGLACYLWLRPTLGVGLLTGSLPAFTHAFAFALLLLLAARPRMARTRVLLLGAWLGLLLLFEAMQALPTLPPNGTREGLLGAHVQGVFDLNDVIASVLGVASAAHLAPASTDEAS